MYDPLEYNEDFPITTPIPNYSSDIEKKNDIIAARVEVPFIRDTSWVKDIELTRRNLSALQVPLAYLNQEWIMIAGRIKWQESDRQHQDTYILWCCTSSETTLIGDGSERYLTIELDEYKGYLGEYSRSTEKPHLCKSIPSLGASDFDMLDESGLVLPPAELIHNLSLTVNMKNMTWINNKNEVVLLCNNVKYSYFTSTVGCTVFMRKDVYEEYIKTHTLKFFAFAERYHPDTGFADETSKHFEIENGVIQQEFFNHSSSNIPLRQDLPNDCSNCPYGFYMPISEMHEHAENIHVAMRGK